MLSNSFPILLLATFIIIMASKKIGAAALSQVAGSQSQQQCAKQGPAALIFLHGLGDTPAGWSSLEHALPRLRPNLKEVRYVFPAAPMQQITINGGATMPGWFDLYDWPIGISAKDDREGLLRSVSQIELEVQKLKEDHGIPKSRIVLGGFSQGGAAALLASYMTTGSTPSSNEEKEEPYAGCVCLSGWLTLEDEMQVTKAAAGTPLFWGHGQFDDKVLFEQQGFGVENLKKKGIEQISHYSYPMGHESRQEEIEGVADFLNELLFE